jgi:glycosyltransferase involved in cell wall biosynthesis
MKVLIGNFHNGKFGGGEFYTYQVAKAISGFAEILLGQEPNKNIWACNPLLRIPYRIWDGREPVDAYLNLNHFASVVCNTAKRNINCVFFPNPKHRVADYSDIVAICDYSAKYVKEFWGKEAAVCQPYSNEFKPGVKEPGSIITVGNFFREADGHSKNQHVLLDALKKLGKGYKLTLVGNVVNKAYFEELTHQAVGLNVTFVPNAPEEVKADLLASSEFYWHANGYGRTDVYQTEHFGIAPEEALKAGCLTYVHASGGAQDFCRSWQSIAQLVQMTKEKAGNKPNVKFQTPEKMQAFWKELLHAPQA